ncbi:uncharacterized protein AKAW2_81247S [Aspergillus luchuensis]|nr:uncharacterized protein AKAW2_81247S [Aspergillus luchuensis]BCS05446.1 hypothetical protein AKAW2_81247S [Aspergillus luchuensis]
MTCFSCIQKIRSLAHPMHHVPLGPQGASFPQNLQPPPQPQLQLQIQMLAKAMHQREQALRARLNSVEQWKSQVEAQMANAAPTITGQLQEGFQQQNEPVQQAPPWHTVSQLSQLNHVLAPSASHGNQQPQPSQPSQTIHPAPSNLTPEHEESSQPFQPPPHTVEPAPTQTTRTHLPEQAHQSGEQHPIIKQEKQLQNETAQQHPHQRTRPPGQGRGRHSRAKRLRRRKIAEERLKQMGGFTGSATLIVCFKADVRE